MAQLHGRANGTWPALTTHGTLQALRYQDSRIDTLQLTYTGSQLGTQPRIATQLLLQQVRAGPLPVEQVRLDATYRGETRQVRFDAAVTQTAITGGTASGTPTLESTG
jgi:hypothetical protein